MESKELTYEELRKIDVSAHIEKKNNLSYLSWAWAVDTLLQKDSSASWEYKEEKRYGETLMVFCTVTAFGKSRTAQLPVMDYMNKAILNPNAFQVNTAMQRCLAKAIALHGIGLYIYAGEDVPKEDAGPEAPSDEDEWVNTKVRIPAGYWDLSEADKKARLGENRRPGKVAGDFKEGGGWWIFSKKGTDEAFVDELHKAIKARSKPDLQKTNENWSISNEERLEIVRLAKSKNISMPELIAYLKANHGIDGVNHIKKEDYLKISGWVLANGKDSNPLEGEGEGFNAHLNSPEKS